jgi:hypothetical protein
VTVTDAIRVEDAERQQSDAAPKPTRNVPIGEVVADLPSLEHTQSYAEILALVAIATNSSEER